jgi:hypothetical protein
MLKLPLPSTASDSAESHPPAARPGLRSAKCRKRTLGRLGGVRSDRIEEKHIDAAIASLEQFAALRSGITKLPMKAVREIKRVQVQAAGAVDG